MRVSRLTCRKLLSPFKYIVNSLSMNTGVVTDLNLNARDLLYTLKVGQKPSGYLRVI